MAQSSPEASLTDTPGTHGAIGVAIGGPWYVFRVSPQRERHVQAVLQTHACEEFSPTCKVDTRWSDRIKTLEKPLFPGYVFARFDLLRLAFLLELPGILSVLPNNLRPTSVPDEQIENIRRLAASLVPLSSSDLVAGDAVTIAHGALKGVSGVVLRHAGGLRLVVSVAMLNRAVSVEISGADLAKSPCTFP